MSVLFFPALARAAMKSWTSSKFYKEGVAETAAIERVLPAKQLIGSASHQRTTIRGLLYIF
jgi:hypothetical protein